MITPKANYKLFSILSKLEKDKIESLAVMIAASNVLIKDFTKKGELIIEEIKSR